MNRRKPVLYLAGAISGASDEVCKTWRDEVKIQWKEDYCLDPLARRDFRGRDVTKDDAYRMIVDLDKRDIIASDVLLVKNVIGSAGTPMEMIFAWTNQIPVVVISESQDEWESAWILYHATKMVHTVDEALQWIKENVYV